MAISTKKNVKRGFVMTGGGAKGYYEAGVMHAFHICGMEFDVITGSSIGAINAIIYAEYLSQKRKRLDPGYWDPGQLVELDRDERFQRALQAVAAMDDYFRSVLYAWLQLSFLNIIDDSEDDQEASPLAQLKDDLMRFDVNLPQVLRLAWWLTTPKSRPERGGIQAKLAGARLIWEIGERLRDWPEAFRLLMEAREDPEQATSLMGPFLRRFLQRFNMEHSLVSPEKAKALEEFFTLSFPPIEAKHLAEDYVPEQLGIQGEPLFQKDRTLADFEAIGVDVRLTRANFRTGRLEISAYLTPRDFAIYLSNNIWRWIDAPDRGFPLGTHKIELPGNPNAIAAAMASGRFPGVLAPYPVDEIYPRDDPRNELLYKILDNWLRDPEVEAELTSAYEAFIAEKTDSDTLSRRWSDGISRWKFNEVLRERFPQDGDDYVDGGAIDNTPTNTAVDSIREWAYLHDVPKRGIILDLYTILLHPEPMLEEIETQDPALYQVVKRTLDIINAAKLTSDANVVNTINAFGERGDQLGEVLRVFIEAADALDETQKQTFMEQVRRIAGQYDEAKYTSRSRREDHFKALMKGTPVDSLENVEVWSRYVLENRLPLQVEVIKVHPDEMPMSTLQFTERMGYRKENAIRMITMGCYNTLWDLRMHLESRHPEDRDLMDERALALSERWMGFTDWPEEASYGELEALRNNWRCQRTECVFHASHCCHGANPPETC